MRRGGKMLLLKHFWRTSVFSLHFYLAPYTCHWKRAAAAGGERLQAISLQEDGTNYTLTIHFVFYFSELSN